MRGATVTLVQLGRMPSQTDFESVCGISCHYRSWETIPIRNSSISKIVLEFFSVGSFNMIFVWVICSSPGIFLLPWLDIGRQSSPPLAHARL